MVVCEKDCESSGQFSSCSREGNLQMNRRSNVGLSNATISMRRV